ncbi:hypothetical protein HCG51_11515 [Tolypothrix sp. PCC 7910]|uniref:hypothetical protein n=1 Tax=Tolypothrix sp. PCC 7910 TaxID=2099387 RepID=UPI0014277D19|nr:hypothetical protein [Tolypothrix sp. PCC 7910]QIR37277.1 hypothetical protein HCG51_11515 [Tolypothrix sp. PCC 7910]
MSINNSFITDSKDLKYISDIVNHVLDKKHELANIKDLQAALKEVSLEQGREIQINLIFEESQLTGFNFSFTDDTTITTANIPFQQHQVNIEIGTGDIIIPHKPPITTLDITATELQSKLTIPFSSHAQIILQTGLQVEDQLIIPLENPQPEKNLKSTSFGISKINTGLNNIAHQLASSHEIDGLLLTGLTLKTGLSVASLVQTEDKPDIQTAGIAVIKRFQQVLSQEFIELKSGDYPNAFSWKDPQSNKQYHFCFEPAKNNLEGAVLTPASLKGFEKISSSNSMRPVFIATLLNSQYDLWNIEQCDFDRTQIHALSMSTKPKAFDLPTQLNRVSDFYYEI